MTSPSGQKKIEVINVGVAGAGLVLACSSVVDGGVPGGFLERSISVFCDLKGSFGLGWDRSGGDHIEEMQCIRCFRVGEEVRHVDR